MNQDSEIDLKIVATAMQVDERYGMTYKVIEEDGLNIDKLINIQLDNSNNEKLFIQWLYVWINLENIYIIMNLMQ